MKKYKVVVGLGRFANHHPMTVEISALSEQEAASLARAHYYENAAVSKDDPIWGKSVTVESVDQITGEA